MYTGKIYFVNCLIRALLKEPSDSALSLNKLTLLLSSVFCCSAWLARLDTRLWYLGNFSPSSVLWFFTAVNAFFLSSILLLRCSMASLISSTLSLHCLTSIWRESCLLFFKRSASHRSCTCFLLALRRSSFACLSANL